MTGRVNNSVYHPEERFSLRPQREIFRPLNALSKGDQEEIQSLVVSAALEGSILAILNSYPDINNDLRPIINCKDKPNPFIIRTLDSVDSLKKLQEVSHIFGHIVDCNFEVENFESRFWVKREFYKLTLADIFFDQVEVSKSDKINIIKKLVEAVSLFQEHGIFHGHLSLSNIIYSPGDVNSFKIIDFQVLNSNNISINRDSKDLKKFYTDLAPEFFSDGTLQFKSDLYSLGTVLIDIINSNHEYESLFDVNTDKRLLELAKNLQKVEINRRASIKKIRELILGSSNQSNKNSDSSSLNKSTQVESLNNSANVSIQEISIEEKSVENTKSIVEPISEIKPLVIDDFIDHSSAKADQNEENSSPLNLDLDQNLPLERKIVFSKKQLVLPIIAILVIYLVFKLIFGADSRVITNINDLNYAWESGLPSQMSPVAEIAITREELSQPAQAIIVKSILSGRIQVSGINSDLIKIAFDSRWERTLTENDRRFVLAVALHNLLGSNIPKDLPSVESLSPAVILSFLATSRDIGQELMNIPPQVLTQLPPPAGSAFAAIITDKSKLSEPVFTEFARFIALSSPPNAEGLYRFLTDNFVVKIDAISRLYSGDNRSSDQILNSLLRPSNFEIKHPYIIWAKTFDLNSWNELEPSDRLLILSGNNPSKSPIPANLVKLFSHPSPNLRKLASVLALDGIKYSHPEAVKILSTLRDNPDYLNPTQTAKIQSYLLSPSTITKQYAESLIDTSPPVELVGSLIVGEASIQIISAADVYFVRYLQSNNWKSSENDLSILITHKDRFVRLFAAVEIYKNLSPEKTKELLSLALTVEVVPEIKDQIKLMLESKK